MTEHDGANLRSENEALSPSPSLSSSSSLDSMSLREAATSSPATTVDNMTPPTSTDADLNLAIQMQDELRSNTSHPFLMHTLRQEQSSVLSLAADSRHIFSGSQGKDIYVTTPEYSIR